MVARIVGVSLAVALVAGCDSAAEQPNTEAIEQQILAQEDAWNRAYSQRDAEAVAGFFAEDAAMAVPGEQLARGQEALRQASGELTGDPNLNLTFRANRIEVADSGDMAYTRGQYMLTATNPATEQPETSRGYYLTVWERQADGSWKAVEDFITPGPALPVGQRATPAL